MIVEDEMQGAKITGAAIDFKALRARISYFFGVKIAKALCGHEDVDMALVAKVSDAEFEDDVDDAALTAYHQAGELYKQLSSTWGSRIYSSTYLRKMKKNGTLPLLAACLIEAGINPEIEMFYARWSKPSLETLVFSELNYFALKSLFIGKDIEQCLKNAFAKMVWAWTDRSASEKLDFDVLMHEFSASKESARYLETIGDINATDEALIQSLKDYKDAQIASGSYYSEYWASSKFLDAATRTAPAAWVIKGFDIESLIPAVERRFEVLIKASVSDLLDEHIREINAVRRAILLAGRPDLWSKFGIKATHFLGCDLYNIEAWRERYKAMDSNSFDRLFGTYYSLSLGLICRSGSDNGFCVSAMNVLVELVPEIMDIQNVTYTGAREHAWYSKIKDITPVSGILNDMYLREIWHPLIGRKELGALMSMDAKKKLIKEYLDSGSKSLLAKATRLIESGDVEIDEFIDGLRLKKHFVNLSKLIVPTAEQAARIPTKYRKIFLNSQLDI